jgi:CDGSH-type Zn-finger protein
MMNKNKTCKIKVTENGPYIITGGVPLTTQKIVLDAEGQSLEWRETRRYPEKQVYSLCRCGESSNKPFCDNTHKKINFHGTETASREPYLNQSEKFTGPNLDLTDAKALCVHAAFCDRAGGIWKLVPHSDDPEARKIAIEEACNCPSGRLVVWDKEGKAIEPVLEPSIGLTESPEGGLSGSICVKGGIPIESANGEKYEIRNRVTLCGCGRSSNKPFCDGTHRQKKSP